MKRTIAMQSSIVRISVAVFACSAFTGSLSAYPEFQQHILKTTGRPVNCALCHTHSDGPEGAAPGQIGKLTAAEQAELGRARAAFNPGANPQSPILNAFGNHLIQITGKTAFLELRLTPGELPGKLPQDSDMDHDGITDVVELAGGTHPLIASDGNPWLLFKAGFAENLGQILLMLAATVSGLWGLKHLLTGFATATQAEEHDGEI